MEKFESCYKRSRSQLKNIDFFSAIPDTTYKANLSLVFDAEGPNRTFHSSLVSLRTAIADSVTKGALTEGQILVAGCTSSKGKGIIGKVVNAFSNVNDRVAAVKMARHMYLMSMRGGQDVWVFSPPKAYTEWLYDEFKGMDKAGLETWASESEETYSLAEKQAMADATQIALRWSMRCIADLGAPSATTKAVIQRWFCGDDAGDKEVDKVATKLLAGFRKISNVLNSNKLVLSDEPIDRAGGGWEDYAFVYQSERMSVIYIQSATLSAALGNKMWDAALTIVHELSHRELHTDDHRYADDGPISPGSKDGLTAKKALDNADNWGFFAADLNGALSQGVRNTASGLAA